MANTRHIAAIGTALATLAFTSVALGASSRIAPPANSAPEQGGIAAQLTPVPISRGITNPPDSTSPVASYAPAVGPGPATPAVVTSFSQYYGAPGTRITIYGAGFGKQKRNSIVWFNGGRAKPNSWDDTQIEFTVPAGIQAGYVGIENDAGVSNGLYFIPFDAPVVSAISADSAAVGTDIVISGSTFGTSQGDGYVSFDGTAGIVKSWADTEIVVSVPPGASYGLLGVVQHDITSNGFLFTPYYEPVVTGISTRYALVGDTVTISGTDFGNTPQKIGLNGAAYDADSWSDTQVTLTVPNGAASGYCGITRDGRTSNGIYLFVAPRIDSASSWWAGHGDRVTVSGQGFGRSSGEKFVLLFDGAQVPADAWSDTAVSFTVPAGATSGYIGFTDWQGAATSNGYYLLIVDRATIASISAQDVATGATFTVTGTNFGGPGEGTLLLAGQPLSVISWTETEIVAQAPASPAYGYLSVRKSGVDSNGKLLSVYDAASPASIDTALPGTTFGTIPTTNPTSDLVGP